ncbi:MAG: peptidase MA family metallohydrolase [Desulfobacterales bacterium]
MSKNSISIRDFSYLIGLTAIFFLQYPALAQPSVMQNDHMTVAYEPPLEGAADELLRLYPELRQELEEKIGWQLDVRPQVVLVKDSRTFRKLSRNELFVAFAVPEKNLIVIDYSRMNRHPFSLRITFKHELCHLLLHRHIGYHHLAKWFEEGICQWASDGIGEIFIDRSRSGLNAAILSDGLLHLRQLTVNFPRDNASLVLAYEQSKSVVNYIERQHGKTAILDLLDHLRNDASMETAAIKSLGISIEKLEHDWRAHLESTPGWLVYFADNLYGILFFLAALLTILGFIRRMMRRKSWENEDVDDE